MNRDAEEKELKELRLLEDVLEVFADALGYEKGSTEWWSVVESPPYVAEGWEGSSEELWKCWRDYRLETEEKIKRLNKKGATMPKENAGMRDIEAALNWANLLLKKTTPSEARKEFQKTAKPGEKFWPYELAKIEEEPEGDVTVEKARVKKEIVEPILRDLLGGSYAEEIDPVSTVMIIADVLDGGGNMTEEQAALMLASLTEEEFKAGVESVLSNPDFTDAYSTAAGEEKATKAASEGVKKEIPERTEVPDPIDLSASAKIEAPDPIVEEFNPELYSVTPNMSGSPKSLLSKADEAYTAGDYDLAAKYYSQVLKANPDETTKKKAQEGYARVKGG